MKLNFIIFLFSLSANNSLDNLKLKIDQAANQTLCFPLDFMKLRNKELRDNFFIQLDSIRKFQYPKNDQKTEIGVDLNQDLLEQFLKDIDQETLSKNGQFEKEYHFNIAPKGFSDPETCKDKISIEFDTKLCRYRMVIYNTFLVEPNWCSEHTVVYYFKIKNDQIIDFGRNEAG